MNDYYLFINNEAQGPYSEQRIREMMDRREVLPETLCAKPGDQQWRALSEVFVPKRPVAKARPAPAAAAPARAAAPKAEPKPEAPARTVSYGLLGAVVVLFLVAAGLGVFILKKGKQGRGTVAPVAAATNAPAKTAKASKAPKEVKEAPAPPPAPVVKETPPPAPPDQSAQGLKKRANQGDASAQYDLGMSYNYGDGVPKDLAEAAKWFRKAADQGNHEAEYQLGKMFVQGVGIKRDLVLAHVFLSLAAAQTEEKTLASTAADARDACAKQMNAEQLAEAKQRFGEEKAKQKKAK